MPEDRRLAAIMFTDIVGYTALMGKDEDRAFETLRINKKIHTELIEKHNGTLIKEMGDGILVSFHSSLNAVRCAIEIQTESKRQEIPLKIGIHEGDMVFAGDDVLGDGVNIASRLEAITETGAITISEAIYRNIKNKPGIYTTFLEEKLLKNVDEPVKVYQVSDEEISVGIKKPEKPVGLARMKWVYIIAAAGILLIAAVLIWKFVPGSEKIPPPSETVTVKSIAVLPFKNLSNDPEYEWLVAGQHETLITELSKLSQVEPLLRVIGSYTVNSFRNSDKSLPEIALEINVDYLVEGSISGNEDSITLQLRLIQALPEESIVLAQSFTSDISNIFKLYSNIAAQMAQKMNLDISVEDKEKLSSPRTVNPDAYKTYLRGMYHLNMDTPEDKEKGLAYLYEALRIDPGEPFAYAGLAQGYIEIAHGPLGTEDDLIKAEAAANQALKLDTSMAEIYAVMAEVYLFHWEWEKSERYFIKALELDPNMAFTRWYYAWTLYLFGKTEEAIIENERAQKIDPFHPNITVHLAALYYDVGRYEDALQEALKSLEIEKDYQMGHYVIGVIYLAMGRTDDAIEVHKKLVELSSGWKWALGATYAISGHRDEAEKILHELENSQVNEWNAFQLAMMYGALGRMDEAFKWLDYEPHTAMLPWVAVISDWSKPFRSDPRFEDFLKRLNLPD